MPEELGRSCLYIGKGEWVSECIHPKTHDNTEQFVLCVWEMPCDHMTSYEPTVLSTGAIVLHGFVEGNWSTPSRC